MLRFLKTNATVPDMTPHSQTAAISAKQLCVGYHNAPLLEHIDLTIEQGEFIAILGPNGAGKTTLLKTLLGALKPLHGRLTILGHDPHRDCRNIGYMPQQFLSPELKNLTARTLLTAAIQSHQWGLPHLSAAQRQEIDRTIANVEAEAFADTALEHCSGGQKRRIMLAHALLGNPKLLLLDEPLAHLDLKHQEKFVEILEKLKTQHHVTVLLTSHDVNPLTQAVSRVLYVAQGQALLGSLAEVINSEKLSTLYQTPVEVLQHKDRYFVIGSNLDDTEVQH